MADESTGGIQIGDAVVQFTADLTQLDKGVDSIGPRVQAGMAGATAATKEFGSELDATGENAENACEEISSAMNKADFSMREARGSAMLLGEEIGVRMNRHVAGFVAQLPGVGAAMESAFSVLAVAMLVEMMVKGIEKLSDWVSATFIFTQAMKDSDAAIASMNKTLEVDAADFEKAKKALDDFGKSASQLASDRVKALGAQKDALDTQFNVEQAQLKEMGQDYKTYGDTIRITQQAFIETAAKRKAVTEELMLAQKEAAKADTDEAKKSAEEWEKAANIRVKVAQHALEVVESNAALDEKAVTNSIKAQEAAYASLGAVIEKVSPGSISWQEKLITTQMKATEAAHYFGQETKTELVAALQEAVNNFMALQKEAGVTEVQIKAAGDAVVALQNKLNNFGKAPETAAHSLKEMLDVTHQVSTAVAGFGDAFGMAIAKVVTGEEGLGPAMNHATGMFIEQIGERALVQGMMDIGLGFAALAGFEDESASLYFEAGALLLAVGAGATAGGAAIAGRSGGGSGAGGGSSYGGTGTTGNVTSGSSSTPGPASSTTKLAAGGLVTGPIPAIIGDSASGGAASEAVLPLDNPEAMAKIAGAIATHLQGPSGGHTFNMHVKGMISDSDTRRLTQKISKMVKASTATLHSSNTMRVTKRSA